MVMIDPAFQRALAELCRQRNIPIIFDEVFSGLWRLGHLTAAQMLGVKPDIACYAKLLTGETPCLPCMRPHDCLWWGLSLAWGGSLA